MRPPVEVTLTLVTPAYAGSADVSKTDGLRPPTLKALLRFWWRAIHPELSSEELFRKEEAIFGSTKAGQGIRIIPKDTRPLRYNTPAPYSPHRMSPLFYMAYGAQGDKNQQRSRILEGQATSFLLTGSSRVTDSEWQELIYATWLLGAFGGFGARSRRGFGSLHTTIRQTGSSTNEAKLLPRSSNFVQLPDLATSHSSEELQSSLKTGLQTIFVDRFNGLPTYSAFSNQTRIITGPVASSWEDALISSGSVYYELRRKLGTIYNHSQLNEPVGMDFRRVNWYARRQRPDNINGATLGAAFGLPQNYQFSGPPRRKLSVEALHRDEQTGKDEITRRASPILFHIAKLRSDRTSKFVPVILWLQSQFLPDDYYVAFKHEGGRLETLQSVNNEMLSALFDRGPKPLRNWIGNQEQNPYLFSGYLGRSGWTEVKW